MAMAREELWETQIRRIDGNQRPISETRQLRNTESSSPLRQMLDAIDTCKYYNKSLGCDKGDDCGFLHICRHFILDNCKYGMRCARSHDMNSQQIIGYLRKQCISIETSELKRQLKRKLCNEYDKHHQNRLPSRSHSCYDLDQQPDKEVEGDSRTICTFHLEGKCTFGARCWYHHKDLPYQWQICRFGDDIWYDVEKEINLKLEACFCKVNNTECRYYHKIGTEITVYFERQKGWMFESSHQVHFRRLSTPPYQNGKPCAYTTKWTWYWETDQRTWEHYGDPLILRVSVSCTVGGTLVITWISETGEVITNGKLEEMYLENPSGKIYIEKAMTGYSYIINFDTKCQVNTVSTTKRKIRRRPTSFAPAGLQHTGSEITQGITNAYKKQGNFE